MAKSDRDHAERLLEMAERDLQAVENMLQPDMFSEEVFGFHVQQAIEKALKSWIALLGRTYPKTHDLSALAGALHSAGAEMGLGQALSDYTVFAVQYRYEAFDRSDEPLDRPAAAGDARALVAHVRALIGA